MQLWSLNRANQNVYMLLLSEPSSDILLDVANAAEHQLLLCEWHANSVLSTYVTEKRKEL